jgi:hypothetical protein
VTEEPAWSIAVRQLMAEARSGRAPDPRLVDAARRRAERQQAQGAPAGPAVDLPAPRGERALEREPRSREDGGAEPPADPEPDRPRARGTGPARPPAHDRDELPGPDPGTSPDGVGAPLQGCGPVPG